MKKRTFIVILFIVLFSSGTVLGLFFYTDYNNHLPGSFIRLFPPHAISEVQKELKLPKEQYQFAGLTKHHIYLHQKENPLRLVKISYSLDIIDTINLKLPDTIQLNLPRTQLTVNDMGVYLTDGTKPVLLKGNTKDRQLKAIDLHNNYFNRAIPIDTHKLAIMKLIPEQGRRLGVLNTNTLETTLNPKALEKQVDGFFCTDGAMHYNNYTNKLIYTYYYRNQYIVLNESLKVIARNRTIDTTTTAAIKIREVKSKDQRSMATPPPIVNRRSFTNKRWIFMQSEIRAKNESLKKFKKGSIIDVYNQETGQYKQSFYIKHILSKPLKDIRLKNNHLYLLYPDRLVTNKLANKYFK